MAEAVNHPVHYGGADDPYEAIKVIEAWELDFHLGNTVKYIARAGKKMPHSVDVQRCSDNVQGQAKLEDLQKAAWYLNRKIQLMTTGKG